MGGAREVGEERPAQAGAKAHGAGRTGALIYPGARLAQHGLVREDGHVRDVPGTRGRSTGVQREERERRSATGAACGAGKGWPGPRRGSRARARAAQGVRDCGRAGALDRIHDGAERDDEAGSLDPAARPDVPVAGRAGQEPRAAAVRQCPRRNRHKLSAGRRSRDPGSADASLGSADRKLTMLKLHPGDFSGMNYAQPIQQVMLLRETARGSWLCPSST